jgi:hypothetical protein
MKIQELLEGVRKSPSQYGGGAPSMSAQRMTAPPISTVDRSAPWTKASIGQAYKRTKDFNELKTAKEKFDFLYNLTAGKTTNKIRIEGPSRSRVYYIQSYDPKTGNITLSIKTRESNNTVSGNVNDFTYKGRMGTATGSAKTYTFIPGELTMLGSEPTQLGRPAGSSKKKYNFPRMPW